MAYHIQAGKRRSSEGTREQILRAELCIVSSRFNTDARAEPYTTQPWSKRESISAWYTRSNETLSAPLPSGGSPSLDSTGARDSLTSMSWLLYQLVYNPACLVVPGGAWMGSCIVERGALPRSLLVAESRASPAKLVL
ncbi:hypothetical protein TNCV_2315721 [Trichonephila clavipes]|nr:hypothetical protein TNCV_2315721 [Trichonephila clavipes]